MNTVQQILEEIKWPTDVLIIDFESYFDTDYTLKKMSTVTYVADPRFAFTGLGVQINDDKPFVTGGPYAEGTVDRLKRKFGKSFHNCTVVAKNNKFDILILVEKFGIYPPYTIDIEDLSRYYDSRMSQKLKDLAKLFKLQSKGDTMQFKGLHWGDMSPEQRHAMREYCLGDIKDEVALLKILLPMLDNPAIELDLARHTLNLFLRPTLLLDTTQAKEIGTNMGRALSEDLRKVTWVLKYRTKAKPNIPKIIRARKLFPSILLDVLPDGEIVPMKQGKNEMIPATAQDDVAFQELLAHKDEKVRNLCRAKAACSSWPLHQKKVQRMICDAECTGGKLRIPLRYYGAHTGRWSGTGGWNPMNLGGKGRGRPIHPLIGQVRNTLVAPDGYTLVIVDSRQIEARELVWVAHQDDLVEGFANGEDIYSEFASEVFQEKVWNPSEEEAATPEGKTAAIRRGFGKDSILGDGFGMGANTLYDRCRQNDSLRPLFDSGEYDWDFCNRLVKAYRTKYYKIPEFWSEIEKCFRWPTKYPGERTTYRISKTAEIIFYRTNSITKMVLPSGRVMNYRHARVVRVNDRYKSEKIKYLHGHLWGGSITENLIQAMCRCLLGGWLLECERVGIPIVLHLYDELVGCVPKEQAEDTLEQMIEIMRNGPAWAEGLPLDAEGQISERYCK